MKFLLKCAGVWVALVAGEMLGGMVTNMIAPQTAPMGHDGPFGFYTALLVVGAAFALILGGLAQHMRWNGWRKGLAIFTILYGVETFQAINEGFYFASFLHTSTSLLLGSALGGAIKATLASAACAFLWRDGSGETPDSFGGLWWKLLLIVPIYIIFYFGAGALIAWQGAAVRAYYAQGQTIDPAKLALFQVFRGAVWAGMALLAAKMLTGGRYLRAALTGLAFAGFMALKLFYPITFMPWDVRKFHIMEIGSSNFLFGLLAVLIILIGFRTTPRVEAS